MLLILLCFHMGTANTINLHLFANKKISRGPREPHCHENFSPRTSPCRNISMDLDAAYSRKLVIAKQFISNKLRSSVVANKSWSTVLFYYSLLGSTRE